jgi:phage terminase small subunit
MSTKTLNPKQQRFVDEYLVDLNATQAAIRAGYSRNSARQIGDENLSKPDIAAAVAMAKKERSERTEIDADWVLQQAVEVHRRCMQEVKPVRNPKTGKQLSDDGGNALFTFNAAAASRALELIGKHVEVAAFKDRLEVSNGLSLIDRINQGRNRAGR